MSDVTRAELEAYDTQLATASDSAGRLAADQWISWRAAHLNASQEETQDALTTIASQLTSTCGQATAGLAAMFYDSLMQKTGAKVPRAELKTVDKDAYKAIAAKCAWIASALDMREEMEAI